MCQNPLVSFPAFLKKQEFPWETFLHSWEAEIRLCSRRVNHFTFCLLTVVDQEQTLRKGLPEVLKMFAELAHSLFSGVMRMLNSTQGGISLSTLPLPRFGPLNKGKRPDFLCGRILGFQLGKRSEFLNKRRRRRQYPVIKHSEKSVFLVYCYILTSIDILYKDLIVFSHIFFFI